MTEVQLRRYEIGPGDMDAFVERWKRLVPVRAKYGLTVLFAFADRERNEFVWGVSHDGDFDAAHDAYAASAERAAVVDHLPVQPIAHHIGKVDVIVSPRHAEPPSA